MDILDRMYQGNQALDVMETTGDFEEVMKQYCVERHGTESLYDAADAVVVDIVTDAFSSICHNNEEPKANTLICEALFDQVPNLSILVEAAAAFAKMNGFDLSPTDIKRQAVYHSEAEAQEACAQ